MPRGNGDSWPLYYHKNIATLTIGGCVSLKAKIMFR